MQVIRGLVNIKSIHRGSVATIGNFDGVHLGHQAILKQVCEKARQLSVPSLLICFEPQPREFFSEFNAPARLTRFREKVDLLESLGVDLVLCLKFNEATRSMTADAFIDVLVKDLRLRALFVGDDFKFGHDQCGGFEELQSAGAKNNFDVTNMYTLNIGDSRVSSTQIREYLAKGFFSEAELMLGRPYAISGKVVYGSQLGRTLDAATANIHLQRYRAPIDGVYAVVMELEESAEVFEGVANVGVRPTLENQTLRPILEVHLFDFSRDIYGQKVKVVFKKKIRKEKKFPDFDSLKTAIAEDVVSAKQFFFKALSH
ncbi:MAG: bifunctional riboflavin kinase/FAD synthetase [Pseudomonadales bacterium]|nr:bifunctional riboflavin kinase/FAD synthetase [Pseudomonadales bacterium]